MLEYKEAKAVCTEVCKVFADAAIWQEDKEDVQIVYRQFLSRTTSYYSHYDAMSSTDVNSNNNRCE